MNLYKLLQVTLCWAAGLAAHTHLSAEQVPQLINYQGKLTDGSTGTAASGTYGMEFRIWDDATADDESINLVWGEETIVFVNEDGSFNVILGQGNKLNSSNVASLRDAFTGEDRYLGLTVTTNEDTNTLADTDIAEMTPRQQFLATGFAIQAESAYVADLADRATEADNAVSLGGNSAADYALQEQVFTPSLGDTDAGIEFPQSENGEDTASIRYYEASGVSPFNNVLKIETTGEDGDDIEVNAAGGVELVSGEASIRVDDTEDVISVAGNSATVSLTSDTAIDLTGGSISLDATSGNLRLETGADNIIIEAGKDASGADISIGNLAFDREVADYSDANANIVTVIAEDDLYLYAGQTAYTLPDHAADNDDLTLAASDDVFVYANDNLLVEAGMDGNGLIRNTATSIELNADSIKTNSSSVFVIESYTLSGSKDTSYSTDDWTAVIAGFDADGDSSQRAAFMSPNSGVWRIRWSDGSSGSGIIHVMFIRKEWTADNR